MTVPPPTAKTNGHAAPPTEAERQEALLQALMRSLRTLTDADTLRENTRIGLRLLLRRQADQPLMQEMLDQLEVTLAEAPAADGDWRLVADRCLGVLHAAEERRLPRAVQEQQAAIAQAATLVHAAALLPSAPAAGPATPHVNTPPPLGSPSHAGTSRIGPHHAPNRAARVAQLRGRRRQAILWKTGLAVLIGAAILGTAAAMIFSSGGGDATDDEPGARPPVSLAGRMATAARGETPEALPFKGSLSVESRNGQTMVTVDGVPARDCAISAWELVRTGVVTVNGVTPPRVSAALLSELCHQRANGATINWIPRPGDPKTAPGR
jgi:hypothetical protein